MNKRTYSNNEWQINVQLVQQNTLQLISSFYFKNYDELRLNAQFIIKKPP